MESKPSVAIEKVDQVTVLRLQRGKGNALSPALVEELLDVLRRPEVAEESQALVITGEGKFFSTGLDLIELEKLDRAGMVLFLDRLQGLLASLYVWGRPVIAAINGHAVAGGCLLAMAADWRVLARGEARIGLTEVTLGLPLPQAGLEMARAQLLPHAWAEVIYGGATHATDEALALGLADEAVAPDQLLAAALNRARDWARHAPVAFHHMKAAVRDPVLLRIRQNHDQHEEEWVDLWFSTSTQQRLGEIRERLLGRKAT